VRRVALDPRCSISAPGSRDSFAIGWERCRVQGVELSTDGTVLDADLVVIGSSAVVPTTAWLDARGSRSRKGSSRTPHCTSPTDVVVPGTWRWFDEGLGDHIRIEH